MATANPDPVDLNGVDPKSIISDMLVLREVLARIALGLAPPTLPDSVVHENYSHAGETIEALI
jgi:hypothetical protein